MTRLSVNINKIATLRNSRNGNLPDVLQIASYCEACGAQGITVHPRPDERHIRYTDVRAIKPILTTEFNIEGNPRESKFIDLVLEIKPHQVTLVPDEIGQLTSDHGWDTWAHQSMLKDLISTFKVAGIRTSLFVDPLPSIIEGAAYTGTDRVELYTEAYAKQYPNDPAKAILPYREVASVAVSLGLGLNAGHDLNQKNLSYLIERIPEIQEVSIGHALISEALYAGLKRTIETYLKILD